MNSFKTILLSITAVSVSFAANLSATTTRSNQDDRTRSGRLYQGQHHPTRHRFTGAGASSAGKRDDNRNKRQERELEDPPTLAQFLSSREQTSMLENLRVKFLLERLFERSFPIRLTHMIALNLIINTDLAIQRDRNLVAQEIDNLNLINPLPNLLKALWELRMARITEVARTDIEGLNKALFRTAIEGYPYALTFLIEQGADVTARYPGRILSQGSRTGTLFVDEGRIALHFAAEHGHADAIKALIASISNAVARIAFINTPDPSYLNQTALHIATRKGHPDAVKALITSIPDAAARVAFINTPDSTGKTALQVAQECEHYCESTPGWCTEPNPSEKRHQYQTIIDYLESVLNSNGANA
jgi:hypothetical protein